MNVAFRRKHRLRALLQMLGLLFSMSPQAAAGDWVNLPAPAPVEGVALSPATLLSPSMRPRLVDGGDALTLVTALENGQLVANGRCRQGARVVISESAGSVMTSCTQGRYKVAAPLGVPSGAELVASQLAVDGEISYARTEPQAPLETATLSWDELQAGSEALTGRILLAPGVYQKGRLVLRRQQSAIGPLIIDGAGKVTLRQGTTIEIGRPDVTLRGLRFEDDVSIVATAPRFRLTGSEFLRCGKRGATQSHCIVIAPGAADAEIDFNRFIASSSMTIKVRAGGDSEPPPTGAYIHHNLFRDIERLSGNGQEPIQVAGPGGGAAYAALPTRIEHNVFAAANGDVEAISIKVQGVAVRWNSFVELDAAPNIRGSTEAVVEGNVLIRSRPIRIAGTRHTIASNIIFCPRGPGIMMLHGSAGYSAAQGNRISGNLIVAKKPGIIAQEMQRPVTGQASDNMVSGNIMAGNNPQFEPGLRSGTGNQLHANTILRTAVCR